MRNPVLPPMSLPERDCESCQTKMRYIGFLKGWVCTTCHRYLALRAPSKKHPLVQLDQQLRRLAGLILCALCLTGYGQGTEQFIPIGHSPGVSGKLSVQGVLVKADQATKLVCVDTKTELYCTNYSHAMAVYLDRSQQVQPNLVGRWADLVPGRVVEVYPGRWIKVRIEP